ncbi:hypothetical protein A3L11_10825 [Thermococcus siculi]|uniref:Uncharacterized protein n=1 Tax=Thermococcus siculi TaxID=72803 RepID=A0A2Z2N0A8_9EURY|nr:hypothetical protein [Thermococcus siculi]ASJ09700.1 hypothetical protein A3L11_10825 [Thermococcus siculi]
MKDEVKRLKPAVSTFFTWAVLALMFSSNFLVATIFGAGALIAWFAGSTERYKDLLVRAAGFFVMALAVFIARGGWVPEFLFLSLAGIGIGYLLAYAGIILWGSDFIERNFVAFVGIIAIAALLVAYPSPGRVLWAMFSLLVALALIYLAYLPVTYVSSRLGKRTPEELLPPAEPVPKNDPYSLELSRVVSAFVEKGEKAPLLVFLLRHSPGRALDVHIERAVKPIIDYRESLSPLAPPWVIEKRREEEKLRRRNLVEEVIKTLESMGGLG